MKQEAWIKQLRDRLADHEEAAPADLWAGIEAKLAQQAAPKRPRIVPLWGRWKQMIIRVFQTLSRQKVALQRNLSSLWLS